MAALDRRTTRPLEHQLDEDFAAFDFYQLLRLVLHQAEGARDDESPAVLDDVVRFSADLSFAFPGKEISKFRKPAGKASSYAIASPNYCVASYLGPLPEPFVEWAQDRASQGDRAMVDFLDIFNHRVNVLRYSTKAAARLSLNNQHPEKSPLATPLAAVAGLLTEGLLEQLPLSRRSLLSIAGLLANRRRSAPVIAALLQAYLGVPVSIETLRGAWCDIAKDARMALGRRNSNLGKSSVLGRCAWIQDARIEVTVDPLPYPRFAALLPAGGEYGGFVSLIRHLTERQCDCVVRLAVQTETIPEMKLSHSPPAAYHRGFRLGYTGWLSGPLADPATQDVNVPPPPREVRFLVHRFE